MIDTLYPTLVAVAQQAMVNDIQNFLARVARSLARLTAGHGTLIVTIVIMLILIYLYLRKA